MIWDHFIYRVYATFTEVPALPQGRGAAREIVEAAYARGLFDLRLLTARSIALLVDLDSAVLGPAARAEQARRGTPPVPIAPAVVPVGPGSLVLFLSRLYLDDPATRGWNELSLFAWASAAFARFAPNTVQSLPCYLYSCLLAPPSGLPARPNAASPMPPQPIPNLMPPPPVPAWMLVLPGEFAFLEACLWLPPWPDRIGLYLSFYAGLGIRDIHCVRNSLGSATYGPVINELRHSYLFAIQDW